MESVMAWTSDRYIGLWDPCPVVVSRACLPGLHVATCQRTLKSEGCQGQESLGSWVQLMPRACPLAS